MLHDRTRKPPALPVIPEDVPADLRELAQWCCWGWRWKHDAKKPEASHWVKKPFRADGTGLASTDDPATWTTFDTALAVYQASEGKLDGLFYTFTAGDPFCGGDMDSCRDPTNGKLDPKAVAEVKAWATYAEVSPTGTGIKLVGRGRMPDGKGRKRGDYEAYSQGRFWAITGHRLPDAPATANDCQGALDHFVAEYIDPKPEPEPEPKPSPRPRASTTSSDLSDDELLARIRRSDQAALFCTLYDRGDTSGYKSQSEADLALCGVLAFWTGGDADRIDRLFRDSKLYRDKWDREDYRDRTVKKALEGKTEFYKPGGGQHTSNGKANEQTHTGTPANPGDAEHLTDVGNARRVVARHRADLRYAFPWKQFLVWDGRGWRPDETGAAPRLVKGVQAALYRQATAKLVKLTEEEGTDG
jgi:primase-polymerase (primpol)-like protein